MEKGKFNIVIGLQAGSESKGKAAAFLVEKFTPDLLVGNFSPNAGHTLIIRGKKIVSHNIPVSAAISKARLILGAGSAININTLKNDLLECKVPRSRVFIDRNAVIIQEKHIKEEAKKLLHIASTLQGVGSAYSDRLMRTGGRIVAEDFRKQLEPIGSVVDTSVIINNTLKKNGIVMGEMTQGFDLDILHGIKYPFTTSRPINPSQMLSDCGVSPKFLGTVYGVFRPYPIRVGNAEGFSGPYEGGKEITWDRIRRRCGAPYDITEYTTTTKRKRRVFEFSDIRFKKALEVVNPDCLVLNFANYIDWKVFGVTKGSQLTTKVNKFIDRIEDEHGLAIGLVGTGPNHRQIIDLLYNYKIPSSRGLLYFAARGRAAPQFPLTRRVRECGNLDKLINE